MKLLLFVLIFVSCGTKNDVNIRDSNHTITIKFDLPNIIKSIEEDCDARYTLESERRECVDRQMELVLATLRYIEENQ